MSSVVLSAGVRSSLGAAQATAAASAVAQRRIATGRSVNSALDNPTNFFTASGLDGDAQNLLRVVDDISSGIRTIRAAEEGIRAIARLLESAKSVAADALSRPAPSSAAPATNAAVLTASGSFGSPKDFSGAERVRFAVGDGTNVTNVVLDAASLAGIASDLTRVRRDDVVDAINAQIAADPSPAGLVASLNGNRIVLTSTATGAAARATFTNVAGNTYDLGFGTGTAAQSASGTTSGGAGSDSARTASARQFNTILAQIDQLARDAAFNGVNLLEGSGPTHTLRVRFGPRTPSGTEHSARVEAAESTSRGLGLASTAAGDFQSDSEVHAAIAALVTAQDKLRGNASALGSSLAVLEVRDSFSTRMIDVLQTGSANLTHADLNEEAAISQALSTRRALAVSALGLGTSSQRGLLRLLRV
jgi:flagellin-like hook-associated protein FlgL